MKKIYVLFLYVSANTSLMAQKPSFFDIQGHRGARGLKPENTIPSFIKALEEGVSTVEMDVIVTKDRRIVVSHEPWMSSVICLDPLGESILKRKEKQFNIYKMTYEQVKKFDCGSKKNKKFPQQEPIKSSKPLLSDVIIAIEQHIKTATQYEVDYSIEMKMIAGGSGIFHPYLHEFSDLLYNLVNQYLPLDRLIIQSFDIDVLQYWHKKYPHVRLSALTETDGSAEKYLRKIGFFPAIYSPEYHLLNGAELAYLHEKNIKAIPWTVNKISEMKELRVMGVDGIITDYPDRAVQLLKKPSP